MNEAVFKTTVMGGFNKSDVLAFVDKQDAQFKGREKDLIARINKLNTDIKTETDRGNELESKIKELESKGKELKAQLESEKSRHIEALKQLQEASLVAGQAKLSLSGEVSFRDAEIDKLRQQVTTLARNVEVAEAKTADASARAEAYEKKLELIDKTEDQIGRAMLESQQMADKIVGVAKSEAAETIKAARDAAETTATQAQETVSRLFCEAREKLDVLLCGIVDYKKCIEETRGNVRGFFASVDSIFSSMQNAATDTVQKFTDDFKIEADIKTQPENVAEKEASAAENEGSDETESSAEAETAMKFDFSAVKNDTVDAK
jgi:cell division septum initiation protein DivIVA